MSEPSDKAARLMLRALNWAYDRASISIPTLGSAEDLAKRHLARRPGLPDKAISDLIAWQVGYAGAAGFVSNIGGLITMPVALPANLASVLLIQLRMIAAIAHIRGYEISDERVRTLAFLCLAGRSGTTVLQEIGVGLGTKLTARMIMHISDAALSRINQAIGFKLVTKAGTSGLINLSRVVPLAGGLVGGGFDAVVTRSIGAAAKKTFIPVAAAYVITTEVPLMLPPGNDRVIQVPFSGA
jgi:EcsC protein family